MKKVLFASTALIATAGIASADVALSGSAEMGVFGGDGIETQFHTDIDVTFTLSGETDGGITFGAAVDLDENSAFAPADNGGIAVFIAGDFGTLTMGDTDGALDFAMTEAWVGNAGSIGDNETGHAGALGSYLDGAYDGQILRYDYSFGDFAAAVSVEMDETGARDNGYALGATYNMGFSGGSVTFGAGYQVATFISDATPELSIATIAIHDYIAVPAAYEVEVTAVGISAAVALDSGLQAAVSYTQFEADHLLGDGEMTHIGVGVGYSFDAITVSANYGMFDGEFTPGANDIDNSGFGIAAAYDFGGGLSAHIGYGSSDIGGTSVNAGTSNSYSLGLAMSF